MNLENHHNESFSRRIAVEKIAAVLDELTRLTSRADFSLSLADIEEIEQARLAMHERLDTSFSHMTEKAIERRANLIRYDGLRFVSLGEDCFSRTVATQWGLKPSSKLGEKTCPFDLSVHPIPMLPTIIQSDFEGYLDPYNFSFLEDRGFCTNHALQVRFNHEKGRKYADNDFQVLRDAYRRRIANFRELLAGDGKMVFLLRILRPRPEVCIHIRKTMEVLRQKCAAADMMLICINTWEANQEPNLNERHLLDGENVAFVDVHYPHPNYIWFQPDCCFSPDGHQFEKDVVFRIKKIVDDWNASRQPIS